MRTCALLLSLALLAGCATPATSHQWNRTTPLPPLMPPSQGASDAEIAANPYGYFGGFLLMLRH